MLNTSNTTKDYRTSVTNLKLNDTQFNIIDTMSFRAKSLYNTALYQVNKYYDEYKQGKRISYTTKGKTKEKGSYIGFNDLDVLLKSDKVKDLNGDIIYRSLPSSLSQQTIKKMDKNYSSFFKLLSMKRKSKYDKPIKKPNYLKKDGRKELIYTKSKTSASFVEKDGYIYVTVSKDFKDLIKGRLKLCKTPKYIDFSSIKYIEIVPRLNRYEMHITYEMEYNTPKILEAKNWLSIDLGINNLCTITSNVQNAYIINGKPMKSMNKKFNKDLSKAKSVLKKSQKKYMSKRIAQLYTKRSNRLNNEMNKITNFIVESIRLKEIDHIVIGYNKGWKNKSSMSRFTNQTFIQLPYTKLINQLVYKLKEYGIEVFLQEESYTSKCSYLDNEEIKRQQTYHGKRTKRGLFVSNKGVLNSDVNGSLNIYRKFLKNVVNDVLVERLKPVDIGLVMNPIKINLLTSSSRDYVGSLLRSL